MSINATFVQVDAVELARFQRDPTLVEALFQGEAVVPGATKLSKAMEERVRSASPQMLADSLARLGPGLKELLAARLGKSPDDWESIKGDDLLKFMNERRSKISAAEENARKERPTLQLDKAWHGVHYLLCGETEPGSALLSQAVLGGAAIGDDDEGFSGYGPARCFTAAQVADLAKALGRPGLEAEASARFDAERMSELDLYPGWQASDAEWALDGMRRLRDFYAKAAADGHGVVTCLT